MIDYLEDGKYFKEVTNRAADFRSEGKTPEQWRLSFVVFEYKSESALQYEV